MRSILQARIGGLSVLLGLCLLPAGMGCRADDGRLLATSGASQLEGTAGGGLVPWAVLAGYGSETGSGGTVFITRVAAGDYALTATGAAYAWNNRFELSFARQDFELGTLGLNLGRPAGVLRQQVLGVKWRLYGDLVYGTAPQLAAGLQYKRLLDPELPLAIGARDDRGLDAYLSASKLFLAGLGGRNLLLNGTLRLTRANQTGLLGFGGDRGDDHEIMLESSAAVLLDEHTALGFEYRQKPDNLGFAGEDDWADIFIAWFPSKRFSLVFAYADLGSIAGLDNQTGFYLSATASF